MAGQALISIALCTYNGERYLEEQLSSIVNQTWENKEIIVVDDCSTDTTYQILERYAAQHPNFIIQRNSENLGFIKNFEKAIDLCNGDFIALADQDDIWDLNKLELQANAIKDHLLIYHDSEFIDDDGISLNRNMSDIRNFYRGRDNMHFVLENCVSGHSCIFKKELLEYALPFPDKVFHDWWLAFIACSYGSIDFLTDRLVKYRQHTSANTDILRTGKFKKRDPLAHMKKEAERVKLFAKFGPPKPDIVRFSDLLHRRLNQFLSFRLFFFMFRKQNTLLYIQRKSALSKFNFTLKYLWGYKLKQMQHG